MKGSNLNDRQPIFKIENENFIGTKTGTYSQVLKLKLKPIFSYTEEDYDSINKEFSNFFNYMPDYSIIHKFDVFEKEKYTKPSNLKYKSDISTEAYERKFFEYPYLSHESYICFAKTSKNICKLNSSYTSIFRKNLVEPVFLDEKVKEEFTKAIEQIISICKSSEYFDLEILNFDDLTKLFKQYLNLDFTDNVDYSSDISQEHGELKVGEKYVSAVAVNQIDCFSNELDNSYYAKEYSEANNYKINFSALYPIGLGIKENHIVNQVFIKTDKEQVVEELERKLKNVSVFKTERQVQNELDGFVDSQKDDLIQFLEEIENGYIPLKVHINTIIWNEDRNILKQAVKETITAFTKLNIKARLASNEKLALYWACFPGNITELGTKDQTFYLLNIQAACLNIFETITQDSVSDFGVRLSERLSGRPLYVDISDEPKDKGLTNNRNKLIFGPSGSGKSFLTNHLINSYLKHDAHCLIVDVGHSYDRLCLKEKGVYFQFEKDTPLEFNPFFLEQEEGLSLEKKRSLLVLLFTLWKTNPGDENKDEYALLSRCVDDYYLHLEENSNIFPSFNTFYEFASENFVDLLKREKKERLFDHLSFFNVLSSFYKGGEFDYLLNSEKNLNLIHEKLIVFELDNIKDHDILFPIVTLVIMDTFITKMRILKDARKVILIEEAWKAIAKKGMAEFMKYLYKTIRKHFGEALLVTQEIEDILGNEIVKNSIVKNTGAKILLDMREYSNEMPRIQKLLSLNNLAKDLIQSLNKNKLPNQRYKEVFIGLGNEGGVYGVNLSKVEYATYTTEKPEKEIVMNYYKEFNDIEMAISQYAEDLLALE